MQLKRVNRDRGLYCPADFQTSVVRGFDLIALHRRARHERYLSMVIAL